MTTRVPQTNQIILFSFTHTAVAKLIHQCLSTTVPINAKATQNRIQYFQTPNRFCRKKKKYFTNAEYPSTQPITQWHFSLSRTLSSQTNQEKNLLELF